MNVERIIVETNDETCNNPVEYDWEFDPDGVSHMTGEGDIPSGADDSTAIVEAFGHIAESIVDGERIVSGGDAKWLRPLAAMLAARIPFVSGSVESGLSVDITSSEFLDCCRSVWIGADMHRGFGRYLNLRWDVGRREWAEASSGFAFVGADSQVAFMLETAMAENDGIRFDPMEGKEDTIQQFRLLLETAKSADIPVSWGRDGRKKIHHRMYISRTARTPIRWRRSTSAAGHGIRPSKPAPCSYAGTTACDAIRTLRNGFGIAYGTRIAWALRICMGSGDACRFPWLFRDAIWRRGCSPGFSCRAATGRGACRSGWSAGMMRA